MMLYVNAGYHWGYLENTRPDGAIFRPSGIDSATACRRPNASPTNVLFDPQLYLLDLDIDPAEFTKLISYIATYPWFGMAVPDYDSGECNLRDWNRDNRSCASDLWNGRVNPFSIWPQTVASAVQFQVNFGCSRIILPNKLITDPETSLNDEFALLDESIEVARTNTDLPLFATVALDERAVLHRRPSSSGLVEAIADGLCAREELAGVYIVVAANASIKDRITSPRVAGTVLRLSKLLSQYGLEVIVNFTESLGMIACSLGASGYGTGYYLKDRRLCLQDYIDRTGGAAYPKFFSSSLLLDLYPERDLEKLQSAKLLRLIQADATPASEALLRALTQDRPSREVVEWEERRNNYSTALVHYIQRHIISSQNIPTPDEALAWLQNAESQWLYLSSRFEADSLTSDGSHIGPWRAALEDVM